MTRTPTLDELWSRSVTLDMLVMATHNAEHAVLSQQVRLAVRHLDESLGALHRKAVAMLSVHEQLDRNAFGLISPSSSQQHQVFDLHREFFDLTYSSISALASALNRLSRRVQGVPFGSNDRFIRWVRDGGEEEVEYFGRRRSADILQAARDFRTVYVHPAQWKPFDWQTVSAGDRVTVALTGTHPPLPPGAEKVPGSESEWRFLAPHPNDVLWSFVSVAGWFFGSLFPAYEVDDNRCNWEAEGKGSAPGIALEKKVAELLAREQGGEPRDYAPHLFDRDSQSS